MDFENIGTAKLASTGRSYALDITPPNSLFSIRCYVGVKDLEKVKSRKKKYATVFVLASKERNVSCEKLELRG